jgi:hypothetical protein
LEIKSITFWGVTPCDLADIYRRFGDRIGFIFAVKEQAKQAGSNALDRKWHHSELVKQKASHDTERQSRLA